jgi:streptogramin lyase
MRGMPSHRWVAIGVLCLALAPGAAASASAPTTYPLPPETHAYAMTAGPEDALWFVGRRGAAGIGNDETVVGRVRDDGQVSLFGLPEGRYAWDIAAGSDGNLWFTETMYNWGGYTVLRIGRMTPSGEFAEFRIGDRVASPGPIAAGPDGNLWIAAAYHVDGRRKKAIVRVTTRGDVSRFHLPPRTRLRDIAAGPDGNLWFTEVAPRGGRIGRIGPRGRISHFPLPGPQREPDSIAAGPDGNLWFTEASAAYDVKARVGRITTAGEIVEFPVPGSAWTYGIAAGERGDVWFTTGLKSGPIGLASISPNGVASPLACLQPEPCEVDAGALAIGPDGDLWVSVSRHYSYSGGGGSAIFESIEKEREAGLLVRYSAAL